MESLVSSHDAARSVALTGALSRAAQQRANHPAVRFGERCRSYRDLADRVARLAAALRGLGVEPGDRVGVLALNSDRYLESYFGTWWAGAVINPVNVRWSAAEIAYSLEDCDTQVLLVDRALTEMVPAITQRVLGLRHVIYADDGPVPEGLAGYEELVRAASPMEDGCAGGDALAAIFYTGGTTGVPKGVMLSHANLWSSIITRMAHLHVEPGSVVAQAAPLFHLASAGRLVGHVIVGGQSVILPSFKAAEVIACIERHAIREVTLVPSMIQMMLDDPSFQPARLRSLQRINYGASPISEALLDRALELLPQVGFSQAYGQTEAGLYITLNPPEGHVGEARASGRVRSAGRAVFSVEVRIVDDQGREVPRGTVGEIVVRGPNVMLGYWNKPEATREALRGGWLHTGDGGTMDEEGYIYIVDRLKDMIVTGGENVYSAEVENAVASHPCVAACAAIGIPSERWGESVHVAVVLHAGASLTLRELQAHCRERIAGYKCPRSMALHDGLPMSAVGKVMKTELRKPFWDDRHRAVA
jgi:long-chain acyl-CoA synthetase